MVRTCSCKLFSPSIPFLSPLASLQLTVISVPPALPRIQRAFVISEARRSLRSGVFTETSETPAALLDELIKAFRTTLELHESRALVRACTGIRRNLVSRWDHLNTQQQHFAIELFRALHQKFECIMENGVIEIADLCWWIVSAVFNNN